MKKGWQTKKIGEVFQVTDYVANGSFATLRENVKYLDTPDYAVLVRLADFTNGFDKSKFVYVDKHAYDFLSKSSLKGGELIMSNVGSIGKVFKCPDLGMPMTLAPNSIVINTPNNDFYFYYFLSSDFQKKLLDISSQVTLAKFNKTSFKTLEIPIPSISEQQRIVSLLDAEFAKIDTLKANAERNLQNAKDLFQAALKKELEAAPNAKQIELNEITEICLGLTHTPKYVDDGVPFVSVKDISGGVLDLSSTKRISKEEFQDFPYGAKPRKGDVIFCRVGTIGKPMIVEETTPFGIFVSVGFFRPFTNKVLNTYLKYWMSSSLFDIQVEKNVIGSTLKNLNTGWLKHFLVPLPQIEEQQSIVVRLDALNEKCKTLQANYEKTIALCDDLKQALLRKAFNGEI